MNMQYRRLGSAGIKLSVLSYGSWLTFADQQAFDQTLECMAVAYDAGVNFFDNAESYAQGASETAMGRALRELGWPRHSYLVSSKYFWGIHEGPNTHWTLNRKYLMEAIDGSLERFDLDHLDIVYCHRADPETPIEETVWAMSDIVSAGKAHYWGTSEWAADEIRAAWDIADKHHLHKPVVEQTEYNPLSRRRVEEEYSRLYDDIRLGVTTFSPLSGGLFTGKYVDGAPEGTRTEKSDWLRDRATDPDDNARVRELMKVADGLGCTVAQLTLAWAAANMDVTSVITGASRVEQLQENLGALDVLDVLTPEILERIDTIFPAPEPQTARMKPRTPRR